MADILVVDDDQAVATAFEHFLSFEGHECRLANSAAAALRAIEERVPELVMMDIRMPGVDGLTALQQFRAAYPGLCVIMMTAYGTSQTSIDAIRAGAFEYLTKPLDLEDLRSVIDKALAARNVALRAADDASAPPVRLAGQSAAMLDVYKMIGRLATNSVPALVIGERGTGKRLIVATVHANSERRAASLASVASGSAGEREVNAALCSDPLGTAVLVDVDQLSPPLQALVAQTLSGVRLPGSGARPVARVLATSERELGDLVRHDAFSRELFDELAVITVRVPPLRERREDIPLLVGHFIHRFNAELSRSIRGTDEKVASALHAYPWPGNVAELERVVKRACIVARSEVITLEDLGDTLSDSQVASRRDAESALVRSVREALHDRLVQEPASAPSPFHQIVDVVETTLVTEALAITNGNQVKAAEILGVNRATLRKKMPLEG